jgi:hypothetical protein
LKFETNISILGRSSCLWEMAFNKKKLKFVAPCILALSTLFLTGAVARSEGARETIVFVRHGEKPDAGLGQLNCQGLNRALALPAVVSNLFGKPDAIFAPNPAVQKTDDGKSYDYVRPLATIEPTAIAFGLPVNTSFGLSDTSGLRAALEKKRSAHRSGFVLVAWEHKIIVTLAKALLAHHGGDPGAVPKWHGDDFDSIYVIVLTAAYGTVTATFERKQENLNGLPQTCPR